MRQLIKLGLAEKVAPAKWKLPRVNASGNSLTLTYQLILDKEAFEGAVVSFVTEETWKGIQARNITKMTEILINEYDNAPIWQQRRLQQRISDSISPRSKVRAYIKKTLTDKFTVSKDDVIHQRITLDHIIEPYKAKERHSISQNMLEGSDYNAESTILLDKFDPNPNLQVSGYERAWSSRFIRSMLKIGHTRMSKGMRALTQLGVMGQSQRTIVLPLKQEHIAAYNVAMDANAYWDRRHGVAKVKLPRVYTPYFLIDGFVGAGLPKSYRESLKYQWIQNRGYEGDYKWQQVQVVKGGDVAPVRMNDRWYHDGMPGARVYREEKLDMTWQQRVAIIARARKKLKNDALAGLPHTERKYAKDIAWAAIKDAQERWAMAKEAMKKGCTTKPEKNYFLLLNLAGRGFVMAYEKQLTMLPACIVERAAVKGEQAVKDLWLSIMDEETYKILSKNDYSKSIREDDERELRWKHDKGILNKYGIQWGRRKIAQASAPRAHIQARSALACASAPPTYIYACSQFDKIKVNWRE